MALVVDLLKVAAGPAIALAFAWLKEHSHELKAYVWFKVASNALGSVSTWIAHNPRPFGAITVALLGAAGLYVTQRRYAEDADLAGQVQQQNPAVARALIEAAHRSYWSRLETGEYQTPNISDFPAWCASPSLRFQRQRSLAPHSLKNGVVLCSLLHKFNNDLIDIEAARAVRRTAIIELA